MNYKKLISLFYATILVSVLLFGTSFAADEEFIDPDIPESWYEEPQLSSELGITEFKQSPILDQKVEEGELPSVNERLPEDPPAIQPFKDIGEYGGTLNIWDIDVDGVEFLLLNGTWGNPGAGIATPDGNTIPWYIKSWEYSDDYKSLTLNLRKGVKWSDGKDLTAEDYMYWWDYYAQNEDLTPTPPEEQVPPLLNVTKEDKYTVTFEYGKKVPNQHIYLQNSLGSWGIAPAHFMEQFHPDFVGEEKVQEMAEEVGLERWEEYYDRIQNDSRFHPEYEHQRPVLVPYIVKERTETNLIAERNPYYPFVDTEGNQLPYIDKIKVNLANNEDMAATKAATGEATWGARFLQPNDIPLYKKNEETEDYRVLLYNGAVSSTLSIQPNQSTKDDKLRPIFQNGNFRKALSLAIDRENINNKIFFGEAVPMQASVLPTDSLYREEWGEAYAEYDPERAKELLDEMGMKDTNDDGWRETPEGEEFNPNLFTANESNTPNLELIRSNWEEVGLDIKIKVISRELHDTRKEANDIAFTCWGTDQMTGEWAKTDLGLRFFAPVAQATWNQWPGWTNWYTSGGDTGVEPPEEIKELIDLAETVMYSTDEDKRQEARIKLYESQAENLWMIGTVGMTPTPVIAKNSLKNVPKTGVWDALTRYIRAYRPMQFYIEQ
ncbi:MAG: ABC transporter substrate-binding protein [Bacillota bacterium]